eukprot:3001553-Prymnesium_polylepis.1
MHARSMPGHAMRTRVQLALSDARAAAAVGHTAHPMATTVGSADLAFLMTWNSKSPEAESDRSRRLNFNCMDRWPLRGRTQATCKRRFERLVCGSPRGRGRHTHASLGGPSFFQLAVPFASLPSSSLRSLPAWCTVTCTNERQVGVALGCRACTVVKTARLRCTIGGGQRHINLEFRVLETRCGLRG